MSGFTQPLITELATDGLSAKVVEPFIYELGQKGSSNTLTIEAGYVSDGLTLPKWLWVGRLFAPRWAYYKATLVHDKLCKVRHYVDLNGNMQPLKQQKIDAEFMVALMALGMSAWRAKMHYYLVRVWQIWTHGNDR